MHLKLIIIMINKIGELLRFLAFAKCGSVASLGSLGPALFNARIRN